MSRTSTGQDGSGQIVGVNPQGLLPALISTAVDAGRAILVIYQGQIEVTYKDDCSPLTLADRESHRIILERLKNRPFNTFPVLSEEGKGIPLAERREWETFWLVDPLDGTKEFIKRNGEFTVNIALVHKSRPVIGVVYIPDTDVLYFAAETLGSFKLEGNELKEPGAETQTREGSLDRILQRSRRLSADAFRQRPPNHIIVVGSRSHTTKEEETFLALLRERFPMVDSLPSGSSLKFCLVADGQADVYPRFGPTMEWDTAAGQAVLEQAGGSVLNMTDRRTLRYNKDSLLNPRFVAIAGHIKVEDLP